MRKLIAESEERVESRMEAKMDQKVQAVHKRLDAFELIVLERPVPTTDISSFWTELASLRADVHAILAIPAAEPHASPSALDDDTILGALFSGDDTDTQPKPARARDKRHRSSHKSDLTEEVKSSKRQCRQEKKAPKASIIDEQLRQQRAREVLPTVAIDVSTTDGAVRVADSTTDVVVLVDADTTEGDPSVDLKGSGKSNPPTC
uniref:Integrase core domain containing protein n=1 Tax=Solanum tuberosum TaxID=4113 RepID=M1DX87_SOLTU